VGVGPIQSKRLGHLFGGGTLMYIKQAVRTENKDLDGCKERLASCFNGLKKLIGEFRDLAEQIDKYKKFIYYGKNELQEGGVTSMNIRLLHGYLGLITEVGELDPENIDIKEVGDIFWYLALICDEMNWEFEDVMEKNIVKLKARYPQKFEETLAKEHKGD